MVKYKLYNQVLHWPCRFAGYAISGLPYNNGRPRSDHAHLSKGWAKEQGPNKRKEKAL